ncbi:MULTISPECIES: M48 family metalloprotease [unclassified Brevundimonas]|uniref:M48 family metalloprotease n=1 Tax=unclassified Brevundimonas TaxID=2622653 RepID=UPI0006F41887|nr:MULTISPECIES: M48 family metalloprotease [unclassified Brevundimonas]KQY92129.1 hypothetical protein ASD25_18445 [Brevundimonas sp. Root1423]KRA28692.1 hypothetical protein ASD59_02395 [Brevundimonas sp. Root608]
MGFALSSAEQYRRSSKRMLVIAMAAVAAACSPARVGEALDSRPGDNGPQARLMALTGLDQRVADAAWRLSLANAALCPLTRQSAGWMLHSANQYSRELRPFAEATFGLTGDLPGILAVPDGSPAAAAGLGVGDLIMAVNGRSLGQGVIGGGPSITGLDHHQQQIDRALAEGPVVLSVSRDGESRIVRLEPRTACGYDVQVNPSDELNARADGRRLYITSAMAAYAASREDLALVLGHELAHHVLGHRVWHEAGEYGRQTGRPSITSEGGSERAADRAGLYLMARAGFDTSGAAAFWRAFGRANWRVRFPQLNHPTAETRASALEAVHREIELKRATGGELQP